MERFQKNMSAPSSSLKDHAGILLFTGIMASGKSTIAQALAECLASSVHARRMSSGARTSTVGRTCSPNSRSRRQLHLRDRRAAVVSGRYFHAGFTAIVQDVIFGLDLVLMVAHFEGVALRVGGALPIPGGRG